MKNVGSNNSGGECSTHLAYNQHQFSSRLVSAHQSGKPIVGDERPADPPDTNSAFAIQSEVARLLGADSAGWKVACAPDRSVSAPIFARLVTDNTVAPLPMKELVTGIEVEFAFRLKPEFIESGAQLRSSSKPSDVIDSAFVGIELIGSRFQDSDDLPFTSFLADNLGNAGYVIGGEFDPNLLAEMDNANCQVEVDGHPVFDGTAKHPNGDPLWPLQTFLKSPERSSMSPEREQFFTTGSLCGLLPVKNPSRIRAAITGFGIVECRFEQFEGNDKYEIEREHNEAD